MSLKMGSYPLLKRWLWHSRDFLKNKISVANLGLRTYFYDNWSHLKTYFWQSIILPSQTVIHSPSWFWDNSSMIRVLSRKKLHGARNLSGISYAVYAKIFLKFFRYSQLKSLIPFEFSEWNISSTCSSSIRDIPI